MRVLFFIPAFLLAVASFVVAAPAPTPADTAVSYPVGTGNDPSLQPVMTIITNTTDHIRGLSVQLSMFSFPIFLSNVVHQMYSQLKR